MNTVYGKNNSRVIHTNAAKIQGVGVRAKNLGGHCWHVKHCD